MDREPPGPAILVIDDDSRIRVAFAEALRQAGYRVLLASGGAEGLALGRSPDVALIVSDLFMPGMYGYEVIRTLRAERPALPIVAISGGGGLLPGSPRDLLDVAQFAGATRVLRKPVALATLVETVRGLVPPGSRRAGGPPRSP